MIERLAAEHADAKIALTFESPLELLVSVMLSAQTTDVNVNRVTEKLFVKYQPPEDYLAVPQEELERDIFATGFYRQKAKSLRGTMTMLIEEYDGEVPEAFDDLLRLPGVARKTANVVSAERGNAQGIVVDTHVRRLSQRLGFTKQEDPGEDRARPDAARAARGLGALPAPADLARPPDLRRAQAASARCARSRSTFARRAAYAESMRWRSLAAIALSAAFAGGISAGDRADARSAVAAKPAKIVYVNVGQGDGVVMRIGGKIIVSDTGEQFPEHMDETLRALKAKQIDVAILSHAHEDHVKNTIRLIRDFGWTIKLAVLSDSAWWEGTDTNRELMDLLREKKVPRVIATRGQTYDWGGASWRILNPPVHEFTGGASQAANASVAYLLTVNGVQALFTGDVEPKVGRRIAVELKPLLPRPVDIFLATHHGSKFGSVSELLDAIHPHWAVISAGAAQRVRPPGARDGRAPEGVRRVDLVHRHERQHHRAHLGRRPALVADEPAARAVVVGARPARERHLQRALSAAVRPALRRQRDEQAAVVVVGGEDVCDDRLLLAAARADRQLLAEAPHAPFARELDGLGVGEVQRIDDVAPHQVGLGETGQLEDAAADREHAALLVGDEQAGVGRRVVVVEQLEEEPEPAVPAGGRLHREAFARIDVERALLALRADVVRHEGGSVARRYGVARTAYPCARNARLRASRPLSDGPVTAHTRWSGTLMHQRRPAGPAVTKSGRLGRATARGVGAARCSTREWLSPVCEPSSQTARLITAAAAAPPPIVAVDVLRETPPVDRASSRR